MSALATLLLQLVCVGMMVVSAYETTMHGRNGSEKRMKRHACNRCVDNFEGNMLNDLNYFLDQEGANEDLVDEISDFMSDKYDKLENFVLVYNDLYGFDKHVFNGDRVHSLHRNGRCGIVFHRMKNQSQTFSGSYSTARWIVRSVENYGVQRAYYSILAKARARNFEWIGVAVIRRGPDLWFVDGFSTKTVSFVGRYHTAILLLK